MSRSDLITGLIRAGALGDQNMLASTVQALINEERAQRHHLFARKIEETFRDAQKGRKFPEKISDSEPTFRFNRDDPARDFLHETHPERGLSQLYLTDEVKQQCQEVIEEHSARAKLRSYGLEPRNRMLFAGPPGNGKTSLARAMGYELGLPVYVLRYETVIGSFLGETSARLKNVFDFVKARPCVFFLDEFDAVAKERGDEHETGEIKRVVSTLLLQLDDLPSSNIVIAATNHSELIDRAAWRRFQILLEVLPPTKSQILDVLADQIGPWAAIEGYDLTMLSEALQGLSYSDMELFLNDVKRRIVIEDGSRPLRKVVDERLLRLQNQYRSAITVPLYGKTSAPKPNKGREDRTNKGQPEVF